MRDAIRRWLLDRPRAMNAAYGLVLAGTVLMEVGVNNSCGCYRGP